MVIGNSYAMNMIGVINEECKSHFKEVLMSTAASRIIFPIRIDRFTACEPLFRSKTNFRYCSFDEFFVKAVEEIKPDVLIMVMRWGILFKVADRLLDMSRASFS